MILTHADNHVGNVDVNQGNLFFDQKGNVTATDYTTHAGGATSIGTDAKLAVANTFTQKDASQLNVGIGTANTPAISTNDSVLQGNLDLTITNISVGASASSLTANRHTILHTENGITDDFASANFGGTASGVDYLLLDGQKSMDGKDYNVGFNLTWTASDDKATR